MAHKARSKKSQAKDIPAKNPVALLWRSILTNQAWFALVVIAIAFAYFVLRMHTLTIPLDRDEGAFGYIGRVILDGGLPYRDAVDHKPPYVFYLYALALLLVPATAAGIHLFLHVYNFLALISLFFLTRIYFRSPGTALWVAFSYAVFSASPAIQGFTASTEMFMLLPVTLSLLFAVMAVRKASLVSLAFSGVAGAFAFWTKQTAITSLAFVVIYVAAGSLQSGQRKERQRLLDALKSLLVWSMGAVVVSCFLAGYFYQRNLLREFLYWSFTHNVSYAGNVPIWQSLTWAATAMTEILRGDFLILGLGLVFALWRLFKTDADSYFVLGFLAASLLAAVPGYAYPHYFAQIAPAASLAGGWGWSTLVAGIRNKRNRVGATLLCGILIVGIPLSVHQEYFLKESSDQISRRYFGYNPFPESKQIARFLADRTSPKDAVFIFGSEPQILLYSQRKSATRFVMIYPLTSRYPRYREFQEKAWQEIQENRPKYILLVNIPTSILWDGKADLQIVKRLDDMIGQRYSIEAVMLVKDARGKLVVTGDQDVPSREITESQSNIYIYRSK
ncbi:MAG: glycosyltransferase family 39 protein [Acidobacteria bacterium]|nr:glycosyltransferase family 39 protein [Acidobacteriota bacterium]